MGCCNNEKTNISSREDPEDVDRCCSVRGRRCLCLPYDDAWMITSQVLSIVAVLVSWIWWATLLISLAALVLIQILWCCRQSKTAILGSAVVAMVSSLTQLGVGIYVMVVWYPKKWCIPFYALSDDYSPGADYCYEKIWAIIAFECAILWLVVFGCIVWFIKSGRHARWEETHANNANNTNNNDDTANITTNENDNTGAASEAVELGKLSPVLPAPAEPAVTVAIPLPESKDIEG